MDLSTDDKTVRKRNRNVTKLSSGGCAFLASTSHHFCDTILNELNEPF